MRSGRGASAQAGPIGHGHGSPGHEYDGRIFCVRCR